MAWKNGDLNGDGRADFVDYNIFLNELDSKDDSEYSLSDDSDLNSLMTGSSQEESRSSQASFFQQNPLYSDPSVMSVYYENQRMQREAALEQKKEEKKEESLIILNILEKLNQKFIT